MAKDPIDNGNAINVADIYENQNVDSVPTSYPSSTGNLAIDGDQSTGSQLSSTISVDLKEQYVIKKLRIKTYGPVITYTVYVSYTDTDDEDNVTWTEVTDSCSFSNNTITFEPTNAFVCRWYKVDLSDTPAST